VTESDPTATPRLFHAARVARGYATARPWLHPEVLALARRIAGLDAAVGRALDVGCGTGLSTLALLSLAREVVGTDASLEMLRRARRAAGVRYAAATAESLPFADGAFDLIVACGSMDWIDRTRFLPRAAALLGPGGWLVSLDFGDAGRSPDVPGLAHWYQAAFLRRFPRPHAADPIITDAEADRHRLARPRHAEYSSHWPFTAAQYAGFLMTESSVIAAVEYGTQSEADVRAWLDAELAPLFGDEARRIAFEGYVQVLGRP
jgi:SAM-dependent methyltransferase